MSRLRRCQSPRRHRVDRALTPPMVCVALALLFLTAGAIPQLEHDLMHQRVVDVSRWLVTSIWPVVALEMLVRVAWLERGVRSWRRVGHALLVVLAPPLRVTMSPACAPRCVWLPGLGWRRKGRGLHRNLESGFSVPMLVIALMILPALFLEWGLHKELLDWPRLALVLDVASRAIWLAFAVELVVMLAATHRKAHYLLTHWIDVAIVIFPIVPFLGVLRVVRVGESLQAARLIQITRVYRVRALALRGWRGLLLLKGLERMSLWTAEKRLGHLRAQLDKRMEDIEELREHIDKLERHLESARRSRHKRGGAPGDAAPTLDRAQATGVDMSEGTQLTTVARSAKIT